MRKKRRSKCVHFVLEKQIYLAQDSELLFGSAALVGQVQVCILAHQQSPAEP